MHGRFASTLAKPAKVAAVENAISQAKFILECIDRKWQEKLATAAGEKKPQDLGWGFVQGSNGVRP